MRLEVLGAAEVSGVYRLLVDDSAAIRHAAADLVAGSLEDQGARHLAQVSGGRGQPWTLTPISNP